MKFDLTASLALRFLRSKKSHGAVSAVAIVSIVGVAIATAAIVCVLSVFNGFREVLTSKLDTLTPDVVVRPLRGKTISDGDSLAAALKKVSGVKEAVPMVEDQALALWNSREMPVTLRGVDVDAYRRMTLLDSLVIAEEPATMRAIAEQSGLPTTEAVASVGMVVGIGEPRPGESMMIFAPRRVGRVNLANPVSSFLVDSVRLTQVYEAKRSDFDRDLLIVPIQTARDLFQYDAEASSVIVKGEKGEDSQSLALRVGEAAGPQFVALDRMQSQQDSFRMVNVEKWVTFLLLIFILLIAGFNIVSTLSMLVIEKDRQLGILHALGLSRRGVGRVFAWESFFVTAVGGVAGIVLGVGLCMLQERYGLIRLDGDPTTLILPSYPVKVELTDLLLTLVPIAAIGALTALSASAFARRRLSRMHNA